MQAMAQDESKKRQLGRGLSALFGDDVPAVAPAEPVTGQRTVPVANLRPSDLQPRRQFSDADLETLSASIKEKGILQPILVRSTTAGHFEIVAGERRWRAAQRAGLHELPVVVRELTDRQVLEVALIENIQRADLTAIEEALGYMRLMDQFGYNHDGIAQAVGKSRSHIANTLRLLELPESVQAMLETRKLTAGQVRPLIGLANADQLARAIAEKGLSARAAERLAQSQKEKQSGQGRAASVPDADVLALQRQIASALGLKVELKSRGASGEMVIHYKTLDQLDGVVQKLIRRH